MLNLSIGRQEIKNSYVACTYYVFKEYIHIDRLEITEEFRGQGYGTMFMKWFLADADRPVVLEVLYPRPIPFYTRLGFEVEAGVTDDRGVLMECTMRYEKTSTPK